MNAATMIKLLRRRLKDPDPAGDGTGTNYTNTDLIEVLNVASASGVQPLVLMADPEAYMQRTRQNIEAALDRYPKPDGAMALRQLRYKTSSGEYVDMGDPITPEEGATIARTDPNIVNTQALPRWSWFGRFITLHPTPIANVTDGLEWWTVPTDTVAIVTDTFKCNIALHNAIVNIATLILVPEVSADVNVAELRQQIKDDFDKIPLYYRRFLGHDIPFSLAGVTKP